MLTDEVKKKILHEVERGWQSDGNSQDVEDALKEMSGLLIEMVEGEKKESYKQGALWAYKMFLKAIKDAKNKFPNSKEFKITVDVRDIERSIQYLLEKKGNLQTPTSLRVEE